MNEQELCNVLMEAISESVDFQEEAPWMQTFESAGVLTTDEGLVIRLKDGDEFHVTVQRTSARM